jgi:hypothetical protein
VNVPRRNLTTIAIALTAAIACNKASSESNPDLAAASQPSAAAPPAAAARPVAMVDLCSLVTKAEAEAILGKSLAEPQKQPGGDCWYMRRGGTNFGDVEFILSIIRGPRIESTRDFDNFVAEQVNDMNGNLKGSGVNMAYKAEPARDVGAPAYFIDPGLYVLKGNQILAVGLGGSKGVAIAKTALARMP